MGSDIAFLRMALEKNDKEMVRLRRENERMKEALAFYADEGEMLWESCENDVPHKGIYRKFITGTCHPHQIARDALKAQDTEGNKSGGGAKTD